jgi:hypothetical protein
LAKLDLALAGDSGEGRVLITTYYNPFDGTGDLREDLVDTALQGSDGDVDCDAIPEDPKNMGLNDVIVCVGEVVGAEIVDVYPLFNNDAPELTHVAEENIHPNDKGHRAIADAVVVFGRRNTTKSPYQNETKLQVVSLWIHHSGNCMVA